MIEKKIVEIIKIIRSDIEYDSQVGLISDGAFDSLDIIKLVAELDEEFEISIEGSDITPENLDTLTSITLLVQKYKT